MIQAYTPPSVVTDEFGNIQYVHGDTGKYLRPAQGQANLSIIDMAREGLSLDLRTAIFTARTQKRIITCKNLQVKTNGGFEEVNLEVRPITGTDSLLGSLIISFQGTDSHHGSGEVKKTRRRSAKPERVAELEQELQYTKENLQATVEEMQASNEELKSTNEELQSTNEELQSTNEELETSKEEIQSVNEEMMTVNAELQAKIYQLAGIQNDMKNLMSSTGIGTIFLDIDLSIRRYTPEAAKVYKLVPSDIGRPIGDIRSVIVPDDLMKYVKTVLESLIPKEIEAHTNDNLWYLVRILPYRTLENVIDGLVISFIDITSRKAAENEVIRAMKYAESIVDTVREPLLILNRDLIVISASRSFYQTFHTSPKEIEGKNLAMIDDHKWNIPHLISILHTIRTEKASFADVEVSHTFPDIGERTIKMNARVIHDTDDHDPKYILLAMEEVTGKNNWSDDT